MSSIQVRFVNLNTAAHIISHYITSLYNAPKSISRVGEVGPGAPTVAARLVQAPVGYLELGEAVHDRAEVRSAL